MTHGITENQTIETVLNILNQRKSQVVIHYVVYYHHNEWNRLEFPAKKEKNNSKKIKKVFEKLKAKLDLHF